MHTVIRYVNDERHGVVLGEFGGKEQGSKIEREKKIVQSIEAMPCINGFMFQAIGCIMICARVIQIRKTWRRAANLIHKMDYSLSAFGEQTAITSEIQRSNYRES